MVLLILLSPPRLNGATYWIAPPGSTSQANVSNNTQTEPVAYTSDRMREIIRNNPKGGGGEVEIVFTPRHSPSYEVYTYRIEALQLGSWDNVPANRSLKLRSENANAPITLQWAPPTSSPTDLFHPLSWNNWMLLFEIDIAYFEMTDMVLDANWAEWQKACSTAANGTSPASPNGFSLCALRANGIKGHVHHVTVKNCGANGLTPRPHWLSQGMEAFPLYIQATRPAPDGWGTAQNPRFAWIIEDCEVSQLHRLHGGYGTSIEVLSPRLDKDVDLEELWDNSDHRVAVVRRCQIRGNGGEIGLGSQNSFGVTYQDNMLVGVGLGVNHDTGPDRNFSITNNFFLDVYRVANIGGPGYGAGVFSNYVIDNNRIRFRGVGQVQRYEDFQFQPVVKGSFSAILPVSSPDLVVGRLSDSQTYGLCVGGTKDVFFRDNWFSTRPQSVFYEPNPPATANAKWLPLDKGATDPWTTMARDQQSAPPASAISGNKESASCNSFASLSLIDNNTGMTMLRDAKPSFPFGFSPGGLTGRVFPVYVTAADGLRLKGVEEVCVGQPTLSGNSILISACILYHPGWYDTYATGTQVYSFSGDDALRLVLLGPDGQPAPQQPSYTYSDSLNGTVRTFSFSPQYSSVYYRAVVFRKSNPGGGAFSEYNDNWSWVEVKHGTTIRFETVHDVADDRRMKGGLLRVTRSGDAPNLLSSQLNVTLNVEVNDIAQGKLRRATPDGAPPIGTPYQNQETVPDFKLFQLTGEGDTVGVCLQCINRQYSFSFQPGSSTVWLEVRPFNPTGANTSDLVECESAQFWLPFVPNASWALAPAAPGTASYATYDGSSAQNGIGCAVMLWDGPKYKFNPLMDKCLASCQSSSSSALSTASDAAPLESDVLAAVAPQTFPSEDLWSEAAALEGRMAGSSSPAIIGTEEDMALPEQPSEEQATEGTPLGIESAELVAMDTATLNSTPTSVWYDAYYTAAYAVNEKTSEVVLPSMAGTASYNIPPSCSPSGAFSVGGGWDANKPDPFSAMDRNWRDGRCYAVDQTGNRVGTKIDCTIEKAWYFPYGDTSGLGVRLPALAGPSSSGQALSLDLFLGNTGAVGKSAMTVGSTAVNRPTYWSPNPNRTVWEARDIGAYGGPGDNSAGCANMMAFETIVGESQYNGYKRAFRLPTFPTPSNPKPLSSSHMLDLPTAAKVTLYENVALAMDDYTDAVGYTDAEVIRDTADNFVKQTRAALWYYDSPVPLVLGTVRPSVWTTPPGRSDARGISRTAKQVTVVGLSYTTPSGSYAAYVLNIAKKSDTDNPRPTESELFMLNLNDTHLTYFPTDWDRSAWTLQSAEDVNKAGWIVGIGAWSGHGTFGYVLIPQTEVTK